jgi:hypothetical protein
VRDGLRVLRTILSERVRRNVPVNPDAWRPVFRELSLVLDGEHTPVTGLT